MKPLPSSTPAFLLVSLFIVAACGLFYELLIGSLSSYFLGNSVLYFSITIGLFLSFMGVGAFLSRFVRKNLLSTFVLVEIYIGLIGGLAAPLLFLAFSLTEFYGLISFLLIAFLSALIGLEIPILTRLLEKESSMRVALANVLSLDYLGALVASFAFPLVLLPYFGFLKTGFLIGLLNLSVALWGVFFFRAFLVSFRKMLVGGIVGALFLIFGFFSSFFLSTFFEHFLYTDEIIFSQYSPYQKIVLTKGGDDVRLFLNGHLQMSSKDEYRYHESLVHIPMSLFLHSFDTPPDDISVLVLGGGDGLAVMRLLQYQEISRITLVDLDPAVTNLAKNHALLRALNNDALRDPRVTIIHADAFSFLHENTQKYSVIIADLPDPNAPELAKLYSREFYGMVKSHLLANGFFITQSTSPFFARRPFWMIFHTLKSHFDFVRPIAVSVPSFFGIWGFQIASMQPIVPEFCETRGETRFLNNENCAGLFRLGSDLSEVKTEVNTLDRPRLVSEYEKSWAQWNE